MSRYTVFHPDHESRGQTLIDLANAIGAEQFLPILEKYGLTNIDPESWYPQQDLLNALSEISEHEGSMFDLVSIGMRQAESAPMPPNFDSLPIIEILKAASAAYALTDRGTDPGEIRCEVVDDHHVRVITRTPDPDDYLYGVTYGYMRRFAKPRGITFTVSYDLETLRREQGGQYTIMHVEWT